MKGLYRDTWLSYTVTLNASLYPSTYTISPLYKLSHPYSLVQLRPLNVIGNLTTLLLSFIV